MSMPRSNSMSLGFLSGYGTAGRITSSEALK
jgi:hypothetical protein